MADLLQLIERMEALRAQAAAWTDSRPLDDPEQNACCRELARLQRELARRLANTERLRSECRERLAGATRTIARLLAERRQDVGHSAHLAEVIDARRLAEARSAHLSSLLEPSTDDEALIVLADPEADDDNLIVLTGEDGQATAATADSPTPTPGCESIPAALHWGAGAWHWCRLDGRQRSHLILPATTSTPLPGDGERADLQVLADDVWAADVRDGQGRLFDPHGAVIELGPVLGRPALMRGAGELPVSVAWTAPDGAVRILRPDGSSDRLDVGLGGPPAAGPAASWWWDYEGSRHVVYRDAAGGINEFLELDGGWYHAPLHRHTGCPPAAGDPIGYAPGDHEHVLFRAEDGHLHELCFDGRSWRDHDLTTASGAPPAAGQPAAAYVAGRHTIAYRGTDNLLHLMRLRRDWRFRTLDAIGIITGDPILGSSGERGAIAWPTAAGWNWCTFAHDGAVEPAVFVEGGFRVSG